MKGVTMGAVHAIYDRIGHKTPDELSRFIGAYLRVFKNYYGVKHQLPMEDLGKNAFAEGRAAMLAWRRYVKESKASMGSSQTRRSSRRSCPPRTQVRRRS
jgi:hypothetical protein